MPSTALRGLLDFRDFGDFFRGLGDFRDFLGGLGLGDFRDVLGGRRGVRCDSGAEGGLELLPALLWRRDAEEGEGDAQVLDVSEPERVRAVENGVEDGCEGLVGVAYVVADRLGLRAEIGRDLVENVAEELPRGCGDEALGAVGGVHEGAGGDVLPGLAVEARLAEAAEQGVGGGARVHFSFASFSLRHENFAE